MKENRINRIYLTALSKHTFVAQQHVGIPIQKMNSSNYLDVSFTFKVPYFITPIGGHKFKVKYINLSLAYSNKEDNEMGISETIRLGTFLNTTIPTNEVD